MTKSFFQIITEAVADIIAHGFDSQQRVDGWIDRIRRAAAAAMMPEEKLDERLRDTFRTIYARLIDRGGVLKFHPGVGAFTLQQVKPKLHAELDRRIAASASLIKLNRAAAIEKSMQRFAGWATSVPAGGATEAPERAALKTDIRKSLAQLPYVERRVAIDQGHKLSSNLSSILAENGGAIAAEWHSLWRQPHYDYRHDHRERDGKVYLIPGSWADEAGLVKAGAAGRLDRITQAGEEPFCRCFVTYLYALRRLPEDMLTEKGRAELQRVKEARAA